MSGRQLRTLSMVLTLAAVLGFAGVQPGAAAVRNRVPTGQAGTLERAWDWLAGWIGGHGQAGSQDLARLWADEGMGLDPNGGHASVNGDAGYGLDPDGSRATVSVDAGMGSDPNGSH